MNANLLMKTCTEWILAKFLPIQIFPHQKVLKIGYKFIKMTWMIECHSDMNWGRGNSYYVTSIIIFCDSNYECVMKVMN